MTTTTRTTTARTGWATLLFTFAMALVAVVGVGPKSASAAPAPRRAALPAAVTAAVPATSGASAAGPIHSVVLPRYSAGDCFAGITSLGGGIAGKSAWGVAGAIVSLFQCGRWLGTYTVDSFCWSTRQWWGWNARSAMWVASWGRYTRC